MNIIVHPLICMKIIVHEVLGNKRCEVDVLDHAKVGDLRQAVPDREGLLRDRSLSLVSEAKLIGRHRPGRQSASNKKRRRDLRFGQKYPSPISPHCIGQPQGISPRVAAHPRVSTQSSLAR